MLQMLDAVVPERWVWTCEKKGVVRAMIPPIEMEC